MLNIKPIETQYKSFRFRSRLEARWAVFLDALGLNWIYENEGYNLGVGNYYLPDFWLPDYGMFLEIKPRREAKIEMVYFAGKFSGGSGKNVGSDWRESLGVEFYTFCDAHSVPSRLLLGTSVGVGYCGPHPVDIGSGHGMPGHFECFESMSSSERDRVIVAQKCLDQIANSDKVFAWIYSQDCYGTLVEIGYAKALGKPIFIGVKRNSVSDDLWFSLQMANDVAIADTVGDAFASLFAEEREEKLMRLLVEGTVGNRGMICYGDPKECAISMFDQGKFTRNIPGDSVFTSLFDNLSPDIIAAQDAARSARFEHGETPIGR